MPVHGQCGHLVSLYLSCFVTLLACLLIILVVALLFILMCVTFLILILILSSSMCSPFYKYLCSHLITYQYLLSPCWILLLCGHLVMDTCNSCHLVVLRGEAEGVVRHGVVVTDWHPRPGHQRLADQRRQHGHAGAGSHLGVGATSVLQLCRWGHRKHHLSSLQLIPSSSFY